MPFLVVHEVLLQDSREKRPKRTKLDETPDGQCGLPFALLLGDKASSVNDSVLPSGSVNHATRAPLGEDQIPRSSCCIHSYRRNPTPRLTKARTALAISGTTQ